MPPARVPMASIFWAWRNWASELLPLGDVAPDGRHADDGAAPRLMGEMLRDTATP